MNQYDTQAMMECFQGAGHDIVPFKDIATPEVVVINTCTVTGTGDKKSLQAIRRAARNGAEVIVAGCLAQRTADTLIELEGVRLVIGTQRRGEVVALFEKAVAEGCAVNAVDGLSEAVYEPLRVTGHAGKNKAVLKIQEGCNNHCSYCIIPSVRGQVRSSPYDKVISEAETLAESGYEHIVLTGIHIMSYGIDFAKNLCDNYNSRDNRNGAFYDLADVVAGIARIPSVKYITLGSLEPPLTEEFVERLKNDKLCPNFHISAQSGSDAVLARMKRKYTAAQYKSMCEIIRCNFINPKITTDMIVGFPGETESEFEETVAFIEDIKFAHVHVFPYSPRIGTEAAGWEQVPKEIMLKRKQRLLNIESLDIEAIEH